MGNSNCGPAISISRLQTMMKTAKGNCKDLDDEIAYDYLLKAKVITTLRSTYYKNQENWYYLDDSKFIEIQRNPTIETFLNLDETFYCDGDQKFHYDFSPVRVKLNKHKWDTLMRLYNGTQH